MQSSFLLGFLLIAGARAFIPLQRRPPPPQQHHVLQMADENDAGGLLLSDDAKSQLFSAFSSLQLSDQYDAVLTGLCAKILDDNSLDESQAKEALQDPMALIQEMNTKKIPASPRSLMALIDSTVKTQDAVTMANMLSLCARNPVGMRQYGAQQADILPLPSTPTTRVKCPDGTTKSRQERLESLPDVPYDEREKETLYAAALAALVAACGATDVLHWESISPVANAVLFVVVATGVVDNFYDILNSFTGMASEQIQKDREEKVDVNLPDKESLPLGIGSGALSGSTFRGITRLVTVDQERESQCEAAALFAAYTLGLPCFAFRPNAYESSVLVAESMQQQQQQKNIAPLLSSTGILRVLVWLLAPVAMENTFHPQLIMSDPREARGFLERLEELGEKDAAVAAEIWWQNDEKEQADLLKWAFAEADLLLRDNRPAVTEISKRLMGGAATVGDCVAVGENWQ